MVKTIATIATGFVLATAIPALAGNDVGYSDLVSRLGSATPTGASVVAATVEARNGSDNFYPDQTSPEFAGKSFIERSGDSSASGHATGVAVRQYGLDTSMAPGIELIQLYEAGDWLFGGFLRTGSGTSNPLFNPGGTKVVNTSWVANFEVDGNPMYDLENEAMRRLDFVVNRDGLIVTSGVQNGVAGLNDPLLSHAFNTIVVGRRDGQHVAAETGPNHDGPGRMKPEIVAPESVTSNASPVINSVASVLVEAARTTLAGTPGADRPEVIKAVLLAGATHENSVSGTWSNNPDTTGSNRGITIQPIDDIMGAGTVHVDRSHRILTAGEQPGSAAVPAAVNADELGWDLATVGTGESRYWRVQVPALAPSVSIVATWNREIMSGFSAWSLADFDVTLYRVGPGNKLQSLTGTAGVPYFSGGNVVSASAVDSVEHLYVLDLEPGTYAIELSRLDGGTSDADVAIAWQLPEIDGPRQDLNGDGTVGFADLVILLQDWGPCPPGPCLADIDDDGVVGFGDLTNLLNAWGATGP